MHLVEFRRSPYHPIELKYSFGKEVKNMGELKAFFQEEDAVGVVEIILILVVLIGLVVIFKKQITTLVRNLMDKVSRQSNNI